MSETTKKKMSKKKIIGLSIFGAIVLAIAIVVLVLVGNANKIPKLGADFANGKWFVIDQADKNARDAASVDYVISFEIDASNGYEDNKTIIKYTTQHAGWTGENPPETLNCGIKTTGEIASLDITTLDISFVDSSDSSSDPYLTIFRNMKPFSNNTAYVSGRWDMVIRKGIVQGSALVNKDVIEGSYTLALDSSRTLNSASSKDTLTVEGSTLIVKDSDGKAYLTATISYDTENDIAVLRYSNGIVAGYILENDSNGIIISVQTKNLSNTYNQSVKVLKFNKN